MRRSPHSPRRQRRALYTADSFERRRRLTLLLSRELRARFHRRSLPVHKGDTVRVLSGSFVGREERVAKVDRRGLSVTLDNVTLKTADEKMKPLALRPSHLVLTRLNLSDPWRRRSLRVREEDVTPEERGVAPEEPEATEPATPAPEAPPKEPEAPAPAPEEAEEAKETAPKPRTKRRTRPAPSEEATE
ncbi:MAG TPA: 50S ribosomal protein L24 [Thermoplasmata archaeon]|nr:50S ribosomal protein L24 [Thermoplasmata archaeon]